MKIYRYQIPPSGRLEIPAGSEPLCVQVQHGIPCVWARVPEGGTGTKLLRLYPTPLTPLLAQEVAPLGKYVGTFQLDAGNLVFHVFED